MTVLLEHTVLQRYRADGYVAPVRMLEPRAADRYRVLLDDLVRRRETDPALADLMYYKSHLAWAWFAELCRHPGLLDAVEALLGPNLLLWNSCFLPKAPRSKSWFTWHQDATYWGLEPPHVATVWLALTTVTAECGCLRVIPGSHLDGQLSHENTFDPDVMLPRGQRVTAKLREDRATDVTLAPGEASIHDVFTVHGSGPNRTDGWRLGCNFTFLSTDVRPLNGPESAILVRGTDAYHHFHPERWPDGDLTPAALAEHAAATARMGTRRSEPGTAAQAAVMR
jgi:non-haem Fe2+, alpha-ketoglutarate-dependent halogenase